MNIKKFYTTLWRVAIRKNNTCGHLPEVSQPFYVIKNPWWGWAADPFIVEDNGRIYLFAEIFSYFTDRGYLGYCEIVQGKPGAWKVVIKEKYHLSFPNIFKEGNTFFICPESYEDKTIHLYKAVTFPDQWAYDRTLVGGEECVDTVFYRNGNSQYGFTGIRRSLHLFKIGQGQVEFCSENPIVDDVHSSRPAGNFISTSKGDYRVSQLYGQSYGEGIIFSLIDLQWPMYQETEIRRWLPSNIVLENAQNTATGLHTYNQSEQYEVIDLKYCEFLVLPFILGLFKRVFKRLGLYRRT